MRVSCPAGGHAAARAAAYQPRPAAALAAASYPPSRPLRRATASATSSPPRVRRAPRSNVPPAPGWAASSWALRRGRCAVEGRAPTACGVAISDVIGRRMTSPMAGMAAARALRRPLRWAAASAGAVPASVALPGALLRPARAASSMGTEVERLERDAVVEDALQARASTSTASQGTRLAAVQRPALTHPLVFAALRPPQSSLASGTMSRPFFASSCGC